MIQLLSLRDFFVRAKPSDHALEAVLLNQCLVTFQSLTIFFFPSCVSLKSISSICVPVALGTWDLEFHHIFWVPNNSVGPPQLDCCCICTYILFVALSVTTLISIRKEASLWPHRITSLQVLLSSSLQTFSQQLCNFAISFTVLEPYKERSLVTTTKDHFFLSS